MRFVFLDVTRAVAMSVLAFDHAMIGMRLFQAIPPWAKYLCFAATPVFVIHFGVMLELVYAEREPSAVRRQFLKRAAQCYVGYLVVVAAFSLSGRVPWSQFPWGLIFIGQPWFSDILKFYCLFLLLAPLVLAFRRRFGVPATAALLTAPWLLTPFLAQLPWPWATTKAASLTALVFGMPKTYLTSLCLLKGMVFVGAGLLLGDALKRKKTFPVTVAAIFGVSVALFVYLDPSMAELLSGKLRFASDPAYYAFAMAEGMLLFGGLYFLIPSTKTAEERARPFTAFARWPLLSFTLTNFLATFLPRQTRPEGWELFASVVFTLGMLLVMGLWDYGQRRRGGNLVA